MIPSAYQKLAGRTECNQDLSLNRINYNGLFAVRLLHASLGLAGEVGEYSSALEKWLYYGRELDLVNLKEEIGDLSWRIAQVCNVLGLDWGEVMEANIRKLKIRYPDRYTNDKAWEENRDREAERKAIQEGGDRSQE